MMWLLWTLRNDFEYFPTGAKSHFVLSISKTAEVQGMDKHGDRKTEHLHTCFQETTAICRFLGFAPCA